MNQIPVMVDAETLFDEDNTAALDKAKNLCSKCCCFLVHPKSENILSKLFETFEHGCIDDFTVTEKGRVRYVFMPHAPTILGECTFIPYDDVYSITKAIRHGDTICGIKERNLKLVSPPPEQQNDCHQ